jgi:CheY-like chemotaxis protein
MAEKPPHADHDASPILRDAADDRELTELQRLYDSVTDPTWRRQALDLLRRAVPAGTGTGHFAPPSASPTPARPRARVLLVDDDSDVLVSVGGFLEAEGLDVVRASNGQEALDMLARGGGITAIVTDVMMPGMSGTEFLAAARKLNPTVPALIITGYADFGGTIDLPSDVAVLRKPFRRKEFIVKVRVLLNADASPAARRP